MKTKLISLVSVILLSIGAIYAEKVKIGDLYYNLNASDLTAEVTESDNFYDGLTNANIPASVTYNAVQYRVTSIGEKAISQCFSLTSVTIPSSVTSIGKEAFYSCNSLASMTIPSSVTSIGELAFFNCAISSFNIPSSVTSIGETAFSGCRVLTSISVEAGNTVYDSRDNCNAIIETATNTLIAGCKNTIIPSGITKIGNGAFYYCIGLTSIDIPNSVTSIGKRGFSNCTGLTSIDIPSGVTSIEGQAFVSCSSLTSITCRVASVPELGVSAFAIVDKSIPLYVPSSSVSAYQAAEGWSEFTNIQAIPSSEPDYKYYIVGSMNDWSVNENYEMTLNSESWATEYMIEIALTTASQFKVVKVDGENQTWYPDGMDNNFGENGEIAKDGTYTIYFRPNNDGGNDWFYNCIYADRHLVQDPVVLTALFPENGKPTAGIKVLGSFSADALDMELIEAIGYYAHYSIAATEEDEFYFRDAADDENVLYRKNYSGEWDTAMFTFGDVWIDDTWKGEPVKMVELWLNDNYQYAWKNDIESSDGSKVRIGDLYYNLNVDAQTAEVTSQDSEYPYWSISLTTVDIPASIVYRGVTYSVTSIGTAAFGGCAELTSVTIPSSVTSIGNMAFFGCYALSSIDIPSSVTSIGEYAFEYCSLNSIDFPNSVTSIGEWAFSQCNNLTSVTIPSSVTNIGNNAFSDCSSLTSIIVESGNLVYDSRDNCNAIIETATNTLFMGCQSTVIPSSVTSIGFSAFYHCSSMTSIDIPSSVTSIGSLAFGYCSGLTSVTIPSSVTNIGGTAFRYCSGLTSITCQAASAPELGDNVFEDVDKSIPLYVPSGSVAAYQAAEGWSEFTNIQALSSGASAPEWLLEGDEWDEDTKTLTVNSNPGLNAYYQRSEILHVIISEGVTSIGMQAFSNCSGLTSIDISNSVTSIGKSAFSYCVGLISVTIPSSVTSIESNAFYACGSLTSVTIPNSITRIEDSVFANCGLLTFDIPSSVNSIGNSAFYGCDFTSVTIPSSVTSIEQGAFCYCKSLTSLSVEAGNDVYDSRDNCNAIIETSTSTLISGCKNTVIPNSIISIGKWAFYGVKNMTSVTIPNSVTNIGEYAFRECTGWPSITCKAENVPSLGTNAFLGVVKSIPLYVPSVSVTAYQAAEGWSEFTNIQALQSSGGNTPLFPGDPGTLTLNLELKAAVMDGEEILGYEPTGGGGYAKGSSVTITAQEIPGYEFVQWSDSITDIQRTIVLDQSMTLTALYSHSMIEIPVAANKWTFICLPPLGDRQYTEDMFSYDGLTDVQWGTYNGAKRAAGQSGWETPESFNALQGYIIFSTTAGSLRINAYQDEIRQGESGNTIYAGMIDYASSHAQNANWNFVGNPFSQGYSIAGFAAAGITSPITVWNGTAYTTYTPGIDSYILNPFEAFFIQKAENGAESLPFDSEYLSSNGGNSSSIADEMGTLPGYFSVSSNQRIRFSKGNLQYRASTNTWRFARNQYDIIGDDNVNISPTYDGWIDLFGWGTGNNPTLSSEDPTDYSTFVDWGTNSISNGGNEANLWRTPTNDEWGYLFQTRTNATALFGYSTVNGISGMIILPDEWQGVAGISFVSGIGDFSQNIFTLEQWNKMESVGAVFLPAEVFRGGVNMRSESVFGGRYWSSTPYNETWAYHLYFGAGDLTPQHNAGGRFSGWGVRLVR